MDSAEREGAGLQLSDDGRCIHIETYYGSLPSMLRRFDKFARADAFVDGDAAAWRAWRDGARARLRGLLGLDLLERCAPAARLLDRTELDGGAIVREHLLVQVEDDVWMPVFALVPADPPAELLDEEGRLSCFICPHGHQGAGKYSVAGVSGVPAVTDAIERFTYDYGLRLARMGYVALCPDARGFGERRDEALQGDEEQKFLRGSCAQLAHMVEPLGLTVAGLLTWDLMRLVDYVAARSAWRMDNLGCLGFSGGGMQALWLAALDERIRKVFISGYLYGVRDSLLTLNNNCSCNYVPGLWRFYDMGDIASLIAPRPLVVQTCTEDHLNGPRGVANANEQVAVVRAAYARLGHADALRHEHAAGPHHFEVACLEEELAWLERCGSPAPEERREPGEAELKEQHGGVPCQSTCM